MMAFKPPKACSGKLTGSAEVERVRSIVSSAISANAWSIAFFVVAVCIAIFVVGYCVDAIVGMVRERNRLRSPEDEASSTVERYGADDVRYRSGAAAAFDEMPAMSEADAIAANARRIAAKYTPYNQAMRSMAENRNETPDDLMGATIMSRTDDDFLYPRRKPKHLVFRPGAGAQRVYTRFSDNDIALRNPVYQTDG